MNKLLHALWAAALASLLASAASATPPAYPDSYRTLIGNAAQEGWLVVYAGADVELAAPLIKDFQSLYPAIKVKYSDINSAELFKRFTEETAAGNYQADVVWSVAMDSQMKLANDGYAQAYDSPELANLQDWAHWRNEIFGTTFEPVVMVYNKKRLAPAEVPRTHAQLANLLKTQPSRFSGKLTSYDVAKTGSGYLFATQDIKQNPGAWGLIEAMGASKVRLMTSTDAMLDRISSGKSLLGYNLIGSYALTRAAQDPNIGIVMPTDYTLVISRLIFISRHAPHPNAARLWIDYLLSRRGQTLMAEKANLHSVRNDIQGSDSGARLYQLLGRAIKPVVVGPGLLTNLDHANRLEFMKRWNRAMSAP